MDKIQQNKLYFFSALKAFQKSYGHGVQKFIAIGAEVTTGYISRFFKLLKDESKIPNEKISFEIQVKIAEACGYDYIDFLQLGKKILDGETPPIKTEKRTGVKTGPAADAAPSSPEEKCALKTALARNDELKALLVQTQRIVKSQERIITAYETILSTQGIPISTGQSDPEKTAREERTGTDST